MGVSNDLSGFSINNRPSSNSMTSANELYNVPYAKPIPQGEVIDGVRVVYPTGERPVYSQSASGGWVDSVQSLPEVDDSRTQADLAAALKADLKRWGFAGIDQHAGSLKWRLKVQRPYVRYVGVVTDDNKKNYKITAIRLFNNQILVTGYSPVDSNENPLLMPHVEGSKEEPKDKVIAAAQQFKKTAEAATPRKGRVEAYTFTPFMNNTRFWAGSYKSEPIDRSKSIQVTVIYDLSQQPAVPVSLSKPIYSVPIIKNR